MLSKAIKNDNFSVSPGQKTSQQKRRSVSVPCDPAVRQRIRARMVARRVSEWREQQLEETDKVGYKIISNLHLVCPFIIITDITMHCTR